MIGMIADLRDNNKNEAFHPTCSGKMQVTANMPIASGETMGRLSMALAIGPSVLSASVKAEATPNNIESAAISVRCIQTYVGPLHVK